MPFRSCTGLLSLFMAITVAGCGGAMTLTEHVDELNAIEAAVSDDADELAAGAQGADLTPQALQVGLMRAGELRVVVQESADSLDPPSAVEALHDRIFTWHSEFMAIEADLAERAGLAEDTDAGWTALSASSEMAAYRRSLAEGKEICTTFQDDLDATAARGAFEDVPWLPSEMSEVVEAVLGCQWFPDDPATVLQWPPP